MAKNVVERSRFVHRPMCVDLTVDLQEVDQFGFIDLAECYDKGIIPGSLQFTEESFNGVSNPGTLISRSMDVFDGIRKANYVKSQLDKLTAEEREKVERQLEKSSVVKVESQPEA